jgi:hypothetical protein
VEVSYLEMVEPPLVVLASVSCSAVVALLSTGWILPNPRFLIKKREPNQCTEMEFLNINVIKD